jgi:hypothetical protein
MNITHIQNSERYNLRELPLIPRNYKLLLINCTFQNAWTTGWLEIQCCCSFKLGEFIISQPVR